MSLPLAPFGPRTGLRGMVAAADQLAASAGLTMLERGGSAADAAVATGAAMAVVGPHLCGLGGDVLAMVSPPAGSPEALLAIGRAGAGSDADGLRRDGHQTMPVRGDIRSVQVPGAVDGWLALHERYGRLPLGEVLAPAIELATDGFPASIMLALASHLVHALPGAGELCPGGPLDIGQTVRLPGIARTLRAIAADGRAGFYQGEFGRGLLDLGNGHFAPADFATSAASWCTPLRATAWGHELWTVPPPSQGYLTLAGAVVAETAGLGADPDDPQWAHLLVETWRAVGHDRPAVLFDEADGEALLHPERLAAAADRVSAHAMAPPDVPSGPRHHRRRRGPPGRRRHHAPVRAGCRRPRHFADAVQRAGLRLAPHRTHDRCLPAQPRRGLLTGPGPPGRGGPGAASPAHPLPHARHQEHTPTASRH